MLAKLGKLALQRCELELLRSHPKDERGSVREIGLWNRMCATPHFLELSPALWTELTCCSKLRKLALRRCELELLRSHPKDERGSVREIGLCEGVIQTLHFSRLSRTLC